MKKIFLLVLLFCPLSAHAAPHAFPVPFTPNSNAAHTQITFTELPASGTVKIYTIDGRLIADLPIPNTSILNWPVTNTKGEKVSTGVYIYLITGGSTQTEGKLVVIR